MYVFRTALFITVDSTLLLNFAHTVDLNIKLNYPTWMHINWLLDSRYSQQLCPHLTLYLSMFVGKFSPLQTVAAVRRPATAWSVWPNCGCPIQSSSSTHHYEYIALYKDISLQRGRFWASSLASCSSRSREERSPWMVFIQVVCDRPGGRLQLSGVRNIFPITLCGHH